jgi:asparagine synthase (glutamine-hydrolysing)
MCGIAGVVGGASNNDAVVADMVAAMHHRGPDASGRYEGSGLRFGATRLRILDLDGGDQPLVSPETGAAIVFNGEIYNFRALREQLESLGHRFHTRTDTEVVLRGFEEWGEGVCERLRGMYAFAITDGAHVWLARDPLGIKPLHYAWLDGGRTFAFASELKALLRCPEVPAEVDEAALADLRILYYVADSAVTLLRGVRNLRPGTGLQLQLGAENLRSSSRTFAFGAGVVAPLESPPDGSGAGTDDSASLAREIDGLIDAAVLSHQVSDVPLCLTLSGGLDSTLLALLLREQGARELVSFAVGESAAEPDLVQAASMARALGLRHETRLSDFSEYLEAFAPSLLACESMVDCVPQFLLFRELGGRFRVNLNGEGADEVFCGYPEHRLAERYVERLRNAPDTLRMTDAAERARRELRANPGIDCDAWMREHLLRGQLAQRHLDPLDKVGMSASVEVRVPYLDHDLVAAARRLPLRLLLNRDLGSTKYVLRRVFARRWRQIGDADELIDALLREKRGFPDARRASAGRLHRLCDAVLPGEWRHNHRFAAYADAAVDTLWIDLFETVFCQWRGTLPTGFSFTDFIAERAGIGNDAMRGAVEASARRSVVRTNVSPGPPPG